MKTIIILISGIMFLSGNTQQDNSNSDRFMTGVTVLSNLGNPMCEEEPITVRGHVQNASGAPINGASVKLKQGGVVIYQTTTNSAGEYTITGITPGVYQLHLSATGYVTKTVDLTLTVDTTRTDTLIAE